MATFQSYNDVPGKIKTEGQQITLTLTKTGPTTAQLNWDIPRPASGCTTQSYNGIVITASLAPSKIDAAPQNGLTYQADPTVDLNLHAGDKLKSNLVVGAFYDDKTTTALDVSELQPNVAYYFTGYAVDMQNQYHQEGVHAYSLVYGGDEKESTPGYHEIRIGYKETGDPFDIIRTGSATGVQLSAPTCLFDRDYWFHVKSNTCGMENKCEPQQVIIDGRNSKTYGDLIGEINKKFVNFCDYPALSVPPNIGSLYYNKKSKTLQEWNGSQYVDLYIIHNPTDPNILVDGMVWYSDTTSTLHQYNAQSTPPMWDTVEFVNYHKNPAILNQSDFWFDGLQGYQWEGTVWKKRPTIISTIDPSVQIDPKTGTYWFDNTTDSMLTWSEKCNKWIPVNVLVSSIDPNGTQVGDFWFDVDSEKLYVFDPTGTWDKVTSDFVIATEPPLGPTLGMMWVNQQTDIVSVYGNAGWEIKNSIFFHVDPTDRSKVDIWWNTSTDDLLIWDELGNDWALISSFTQSDKDPAVQAPLEVKTLWFNEELKLWDGSEWVSIDVIYYNTDPTKLPNGTIWRNPLDGWYQLHNVNDWIQLDVLEWTIRPGDVVAGIYWYSNANLMVWNGMTWIAMMFSETSHIPSEGYTYFNSTEDISYTWTKGAWRVAEMPLMAFLNEKGNIVITTNITGSSAFVEVIDGDLFRSLCEEVRFATPALGTDNIPGVQGSEVLGVGTDGSDDERRKLITELRHQLGAPVYNVELTKEQFDTCIRLALEELRRRSASAYKRGFFFLQIEPGKQTYELSNKTTGFNKITEVMSAYRIQSSFLGNATGQGAYGQAMLQHLYQMGSFDLVSYHIVSEYVELMNELFAAYLVYNWNEDTRKLQFYQTFGSNEKVLLDSMIERTEQELMRDRYTKTWIERYALAKAQLMLAEIRGRYASLPGAGGGISLNAQELKISAEANFEWCEDEINNYIVNEIESVGMGGDFILG